MEDFYLVGKETGQNYRTVKKGSNIISPEQREAIEKKKRRIASRSIVRFSNTKIEAIDYVCENLTNTQIGFLMVLQKYLSYDGVLVKNQKTKTPMTRKEIMKALDVESKPSTFNDFRKSCIDKGIVIYDKKNKEYSINKDVIFKGKFKMLNVVSAVCNDLEKISTNLKPVEKAIIFKLQKYVHRHSMELVKNPEETNTKKLEYLSIDDLSEVLSVSKSYIYKKLYMMVYDGEYVLARVSVGRRKSFMLNPRVFFRGDYQDVQDRVTKTYKSMFEIKD